MQCLYLVRIISENHALLSGWQAGSNSIVSGLSVND